MFSATAWAWIALVAVFGFFGIVVRNTLREIEHQRREARRRGAAEIRREVVQEQARKRREERRRERQGER